MGECIKCSRNGAAILPSHTKVLRHHIFTLHSVCSLLRHMAQHKLECTAKTLCHTSDHDASQSAREKIHTNYNFTGLWCQPQPCLKRRMKNWAPQSLYISKPEWVSRHHKICFKELTFNKQTWRCQSQSTGLSESSWQRQDATTSTHFIGRPQWACILPYSKVQNVYLMLGGDNYHRREHAYPVEAASGQPEDVTSMELYLQSLWLIFATQCWPAMAEQWNSQRMNRNPPRLYNAHIRW